MDAESQVVEQEQLAPADEVVSSEPTETPEESPVLSQEEDQEIADLQAAIDEAETPEAKAAQQKKLNVAFARLRRDGKEWKDKALEAIQDAAYRKGIIEASKPPVEEKKPEPAYAIPEFTTPAPRELDFEDEQEYRQARDEWLVAKAEHGAYHKAKAEIVEDQHRREQEQATTAYVQWKTKGLEKFPDFLRVAKPDEIQLTMAMREAIRNSEMSHEIAYYLGQNPKEYDRIIGISNPWLQAAAIGKIEDRVKDKPKPKTKSDAPAPIVPLGDKSNFVSKKVEDMTMQEYNAYMNEKEFGGRK